MRPLRCGLTCAAAAEPNRECEWSANLDSLILCDALNALPLERLIYYYVAV